MSDQNNHSRRRLLKAVAGAGGLVTAGKLLPETWTRPVVDAVSLPAHAQTSGEYYDTFTEVPPDMVDEVDASGSRPRGILDLIVPAAHAQMALIELHMCISPAGDMARVDLVAPEGGPDGGGIHHSTMAPIGGGAVPFDVEAVGAECPPEPKVPEISVQVDSLAKGTVFVFDTVWFTFDLPQQACRLPRLAPCKKD